MWRNRMGGRFVRPVAMTFLSAARLVETSTLAGGRQNGAAFCYFQQSFYHRSMRIRELGVLSEASVVREPLPASKLRWTCDPDQFQFKTTAELNDLEGSTLLGQDRATSAIEFGVGMRRDGYNLYVLGPAGAGKRTVVQKYLEQRATDEDSPSDWCYVYNFENADVPKSLELPAGMGRILGENMDQLVEDLKEAIPAEMENEEHRKKLRDVEKVIAQDFESTLKKLSSEAKALGFEIARRPTGFALFIPNSSEVAKMTLDEQAALEKASEQMEPKMQDLVKRLNQATKETREKTKELNQEAARRVVESLFSSVKEIYADQPKVLEYLKAAEKDIVENSSEFESSEESGMAFLFMQKRQKFVNRYRVNTIVDNGETKGAPVIYEDHPYYHNLMGRVEHESQLGSLVTDFSLIKAGALHRANGGFLVMRVRDVLLQPFSWEALKRALRSGRLQMESLGAELSLISTVSLQPEPIPLDLKVVLIGDRMLYYLLQAYDEDFNELFKVAADFSDETDRSEESCQVYARMVATIGNSEDARPMDRAAVALMIEQAARNVGDQEKLSTHMLSTTDLLRESDYWAKAEASDVIEVGHVKKAIDQQIYRADRLRELAHEQIRRGTLLVDVVGERIGQVNGLSVMSLGSLAFGRPSRITATGRLGRGKVIDIEREVELGGPIHSKGVLILSSLLASRYARDFPLSLSASLVFEQSYGMVEGDSASVAELCALLSDLAQVPIRQNLAVTGSLNQHGEAQAIGGVNEKIEGYFDVCTAIGLTGDQGVLIPSSNEKHLMIRQDVVEAVDKKKFSVYAYDDIDEAMSLLTGVAAGERDIQGNYPPDTVNFLVDRRLRELADLMVSFSEKSENNDSKKQ